MTRRSKREIENALDGLNSGTTDDTWGPVHVWEDTETGEWYVDRDEDADPVDKDELREVYPAVIVYDSVIDRVRGSGQ